MTKIYAPNVHLFAFHLGNSIGETNNSKVVDDGEFLWVKCNAIFDKLNIDKSLMIQADSPEERAKEVNENSAGSVRVKEATTNNSVHPYPEKGAIAQLERNIQVDNDSKPSIFPLTGIVYPRHLYDSDSLTFNIRRSEKLEAENFDRQPPSLVPISIFRDFNPDDCLLPDFIDSSLGQTLLLTAWLDEGDHQLNWRQIADDCLAEFIPDRKKRPKFNAKGKLFGSPIFEYGQIPDEPGMLSQLPRSCHIIIWLFCKKDTSQKFDFCYGNFPDLFLFRNKVIRTFEDTRTEYNQGGETYQQIEEDILEIDRFLDNLPSNGEIGDTNLQMLKEKLRTMPKLSLVFSQVLRNLEHNCKIIAINAKIYTEVLEEMRRKLEANLEYLPNTDLSFFEMFSEKDCPYLQERIQADLGDFVHGSSLVDKAIASIRGLVEIEQAERNTKLQITVFAVGSGVSAGIIFATSYTLLAQQPTLYTPLISSSLTPSLSQPFYALTKSVSYSIIFGILAGIIAYKIASFLFQSRWKNK